MLPTESKLGIGHPTIMKLAKGLMDRPSVSHDALTAPILACENFGRTSATALAAGSADEVGFDIRKVVAPAVGVGFDVMAASMIAARSGCRAREMRAGRGW